MKQESSVYLSGLLASDSGRGNQRRRRWDVESQVASWVLFDLNSFPHGFLCQLFHDLCDCPVAPKPRGVQTDLQSATYPQTLRKLKTNNFSPEFPL